MKKVQLVCLAFFGVAFAFNASAQDIKQKKQVEVRTEIVEKVQATQQPAVIQSEKPQQAPQQVTSGSRPLNRVQAKQPVLQRVPASERNDIKKNNN